MNVRELLTEGTARLSVPATTANITAPALDAALLLAHALHTTREKLLIHDNDPAGENERADYAGLLARRKNGECMAYILGRKEFYGLDFLVNPSVLVPRPETEILLETALEYIDARKKKDLSVLDLCTGSGALAVALKKERPVLKVTASDISGEALAIAAQNASRLLQTGSSVNFLQSDLFEKIPDAFDIIISNPPYIMSCEIEKLQPEVRMEPVIALDGGSDGLEIIKKIITQAQSHLRPEGILMLEADARQMKVLVSVLEENSFGNVKIYKDLAGLERVIAATTA